MTFAYSGESWNSITVISGCDPTDLSWHFLIFMTIREELFKNYRSRTSEKWKAKEDNAGDFKKQKMQKNDDGQSYANWQTSSWSWHQPMTLGFLFLATIS